MFFLIDSSRSSAAVFLFMTVDTFVSMLAYTSGLKWRPNSFDRYRREIDARSRASVCGLAGEGGGGVYLGGLQ